MRAAVERKLPGVPLIEGAEVRNAAGKAVGLNARYVGQHGVWRGFGHAPVGDERLLALVQGWRDPVTLAAFASGKAVVFDHGLIRDGRLTLDTYVWSEENTETREITVPAVVARAADPRYAIAVLPLAAVRGAGLKTEPHVLYIDPASHRLTARQGGALEWELQGTVPSIYVTVERGFGDDVAPQMWLLLGAALVLVLGGTFVATGLAAADMRPDLTTMAAVGAPPGTRRLVVAGQAGFIAGLGVLVGALAGAVTGVAATWPLTAYRYGEVMTSGGEIFPVPSVPPTIEIPWLLLAAVVIGLPVLAAVLAGAFARTRTTLARRTG